MAADSTVRDGSSEREGAGSLQPAGGCGAGSGDPAVLHAVPLGSAAGAGGARRVAESRSGGLLRGLRGDPGEAFRGSDYGVGSLQHAVVVYVDGVRSGGVSARAV